MNTSDVVFEGHGNAGMEGDFEAEDSGLGGGAWVPMQPPRALTVASQEAGRRARKGCDHAGTAFARLKRRREKVIASACR